MDTMRTRMDKMKRKVAKEDLEHSKRIQKRRQEWIAERRKNPKTTYPFSQIERLNEWSVLTATGATHQWQLIECELAQKKALLRATLKVMLSMEGKNDSLRMSLEKLYEDVEQLETKLEKAIEKEEDKPAATSSSKF
jgi:hypothetical protein